MRIKNIIEYFFLNNSKFESNLKQNLNGWIALWNEAVLYSFSNSWLKLKRKEKQIEERRKGWLPPFLIPICLMGNKIIEMTTAVDHSGPIIGLNWKKKKSTLVNISKFSRDTAKVTYQSSHTRNYQYYLPSVRKFLVRLVFSPVHHFLSDFHIIVWTKPRIFIYMESKVYLL